MFIIHKGGERVALTNVVMWTDKGWKNVTIDEAISIYPSTVSAHGGQFCCRLCKQNVTLTAHRKRSRRFSHVSSYADKQCDDRALSSPVIKFEMHEFIPPIRINIYNQNSFSLDMGFVLPPEVNNKGKIIITSANDPKSIVEYNISRLSMDSLTYLSIGSIPAEKYIINVSESSLNLPHIVDGIKKSGVLFDYNTRKKLPDDADVIVDHNYLYLTQNGNLYNSDVDVVVSNICSIKEWYVYSIKAKSLSKTTADFFLKLGYWLTEKKTSLTFLWPEYVVTPYIIKHEKELVYLYIQGESIIPQIYPEEKCLSYQQCDNGNGVAVAVKCSGRKQLLSVGRTKVLRYTYLWKEKLNFSQAQPPITITDIKGKNEAAGINNKLPEKKILQIKAEYDSYIEIMKDGWAIDKIKIKANEILEIDHLQFGMTINVFQGLECVWSVSYVKQQKTVFGNEEELLWLLQNAGGKKIPISHLFSVTINKYRDYPKIQKWIYTQIRNGFISERAYKIIKGENL